MPAAQSRNYDTVKPVATEAEKRVNRGVAEKNVFTFLAKITFYLSYVRVNRASLSSREKKMSFDAQNSAFTSASNWKMISQKWADKGYECVLFAFRVKQVFELV